MALLDHSSQGLVLRKPFALASDSFLLAGDPSARQHSSLIILLMVHFRGHVWHGLSQILDKSEECF